MRSNQEIVEGMNTPGATGDARLHTHMTVEEARRVQQAVSDAVGDGLLMFLYDMLQREYVKGIRCGVCGRTDGGDDCTYNC